MRMLDGDGRRDVRVRVVVGEGEVIVDEVKERLLTVSEGHRGEWAWRACELQTRLLEMVLI